MTGPDPVVEAVTEALDCILEHADVSEHLTTYAEVAVKAAGPALERRIRARLIHEIAEHAGTFSSSAEKDAVRWVANQLVNADPEAVDDREALWAKALTFYANEEVDVNGDVFRRDDLPDILANVTASRDEYARQAKAGSEARAEAERLRSKVAQNALLATGVRRLLGSPISRPVLELLDAITGDGPVPAVPDSLREEFRPVDPAKVAEAKAEVAALRDQLAASPPVNIEERPEDTARRFAGELTAIDKTLRETREISLTGVEGVQQLGRRYREALSLLDQYRGESGRLRVRFDEVVAEKNQAIEAWGKATEERDAARRTAEHYRAMKCAVCGKPAAYVNVAGEVIGWGCADGNECTDAEVGMGDLAVMLDEVLRHVTALPGNMRYRTRFPARRSTTATPARPAASDRPEHRPAGNVSASKYASGGPKPVSLRDQSRAWLREFQETRRELEGRATLRDIMAAAYRNGLRLRKDVDCAGQANAGEQWHLREWSITNAHGRQVGRLEVEEGPQTYVRILSRRNENASNRLLTDPTLGDVLAAARLAGLITK
jgi:hypothetical protein